MKHLLKRRESVANSAAPINTMKPEKFQEESAVANMKLVTTATGNVRSSELSSGKRNTKTRGNDEITDDVVEKEIKKPQFRILIQRKNAFKELNVTATKDSMDIENLKNIFKCGYCSELFSNDCTLINHLLTHDKRPYKPIQSISQSDNINHKVINKKDASLTATNLLGSTASANTGQKFMYVVCTPPEMQNKTNVKLSSKTRQSTTETSNLKKTACKEQNTEAEILDLTNDIAKRQENRDSVEEMLSLSPIVSSFQSNCVQVKIPTKSMSSVGKRKAKKKFHDDFIRYELNIKKLKHKNKHTTDSEVTVIQKKMNSKNTPKTPNKNHRNNCKLSTKQTLSEFSVKYGHSFKNEKKSNNASHDSVEIVQKETKTCTTKCQSLKDFNIQNNHGCPHSYSCSQNTGETEKNVNKNTSIMSGHSDNMLTIKPAKIRRNRLNIFLRCVTCKGCYLWKYPFLNHLKVHPNERPFECITCKTRFWSSFNYMTHRRTYHSPDKIHCCYKCPKRYTSWYLLKLHLIKHKACSSSKYVCTLCKRSFRYKYTLSRHLANEHVETKQVSQVTLSCSDCGKSFKDRRNLWIHKKRHPNALKPYKCNFCHKKFAVHKWLVDHVQRHIPERNYPCRRCGKCYFTKNDATMHERRHTKEATFACSECDKKFIYKSELNAHIKRHQGISLPKNIVCDICSKPFSTRRDLERHLTVHSGEKPYKCHICSKCFSQEINMQVHVKIHSGERPFQCDLCDKRFIAKSKLIRHRQCHTTSKGMLLRPFKCVLCPKKYTAENSLIRHLKTHRDSVEVIANIKSSLSKAVEESSAAQPSPCGGAVLACMIDQAILDAKRMAHNRKNNVTTSDPSLAEIIDQAIHDSKSVSSTQTPIVIDSFNNTCVNIQVPSSSISKSAELVGQVETNISETSTDKSTNTCSDLIKVISDVLSKNIGTSQELNTKQSTSSSVPSIYEPFTQAVVVKPKDSMLKPRQFIQINKNSNQSLLLTEQKVINLNPLLETIEAPLNIISHHPTMKISMNQHIFVENFNLTTDASSSQNKTITMPVSDLGTVGSEQVILLDALSEQSGLHNTCQQNTLSVNKNSTLIMIPLSPDKDFHAASPHNSTRHVQQFVLPKDVAYLTKKEQFVLVPADTSRKNYPVLLKKSAIPRKMEPVIVKTSGRHMLMIPSLDENFHLPVAINNADETSEC